MPLKISSVQIADEKELRSLIISNLPSFISGCKILDNELPIPGAPIYILNELHQSVLVVFDLESAARALIKGLNSLDFVMEHGHLMSRIQTMSHMVSVQAAPSLMVIAPGPVPGAKCLQQAPVSILTKVFRPLSVNGEVSIYIEPDTQPELSAVQVVKQIEQADESVMNDDWSGTESIHDIFNLSDEEQDFFTEV
ncbi:MAG: hypothetical protein OEZ38_03785 [Gammaproteobacteria bacterium]|nr:hypothetical protein [Gammaproteobacteria bacterium]